MLTESLNVLEAIFAAVKLKFKVTCVAHKQIEFRETHVVCSQTKNRRNTCCVGQQNTHLAKAVSGYEQRGLRLRLRLKRQLLHLNCSRIKRHVEKLYVPRKRG